MVFNEFFTTMVLPFLLVFVVVFAILQKSQVLGKEKAQMDAIVGFVVGLLTVAVAPARQVIVEMMPWMAVAIAVIMVFLILYGFVAGDISTDTPSWMKPTFAILAGVFTVGVILYVSGWGKWLLDLFAGDGDGSFLANLIFLVLIVGVVIVAVKGGKASESKPK